MNRMNSPAVRSFVWRLGRRLYCWARREVSSGFEENGERWLLQNVLSDADRSKPAILLDIGTFRGNWAESALTMLKGQNITGHVHAFEPASYAYACLVERFKGNNLVSTNRIALSDKSGERVFFVVGEMCGINSLLKIDGASKENVTTLRLDDFLAEQRIDHVLFVKSDTEGHDLNVLQGATKTLLGGRIDVWQFEYNHRWVGGRSYLRDVFDFIADKPYLLGKLYGNGIETYEGWHPELERFFESNYVLVKKGSRYEKLCSRVHFNNRNVLISD